MLNDLFQCGVAVKVLDGIAAGDHVERSLILDLALALAEDRRRDIMRKTKNGLDSARTRGRIGGRPTVVDEDKRRAIIARRAEGESLRMIARGIKASLVVVHRVVTAHELQIGRNAALTPAAVQPELPVESPGIQDLDGEPRPMPVQPKLSTCPTCGHRPANKRDRELLRVALGTVWLAIDANHPGEVLETWHCDQCQPHGAELILCPRRRRHLRTGPNRRPVED